jgi:hypothetical protein
MNCFESRRRLLAGPRELVDEHDEHLSGCESCARLAADLAALDRKMNKATRIPVPDGLADRIILARGYPGRWHYAAGIAAAILFAAISVVTLAPDVLDSYEPTLAADAVGPTHPAVAAISMVAGRAPGPLTERTAADATAVQARLKFLGLALKGEGVSARYVGTCEVAGRDCDHLILDTPEGDVSVILMASEHPSVRVLVADRNMTALLSPAPTGAYIVVAASPKAARRAQKLFVHG